MSSKYLEAARLLFDHPLFFVGVFALIAGLSLGSVYFGLAYLQNRFQLKYPVVSFLAAGFRGPLFWGALVVSFQLSRPFGPGWIKTATQWDSAARFILIYLLFIGLSHFLVKLIREKYILQKIAATNEALVILVMRLLIWTTATLLLLEQLGVSITPLLTSLGIGSLAVALALQDTLSNYFSGVYMLIDKPLKPGDFVKLDDIEGYVIKIGWRSTEIRSLLNHTVVIPNSKLASSVTTNYSLPDPMVVVRVDVSVSYSADLEKVEKLFLECANQLVKKLGLNPNPPPALRFASFGESGIDLRLFVNCDKLDDQYTLRHELIKAIHRCCKDNHIEIPFPQRVVHLIEAGH